MPGLSGMEVDGEGILSPELLDPRLSTTIRLKLLLNTLFFRWSLLRLNKKFELLGT